MRLAIEIGSRSTLVDDEGPKLDRYAEGLRPREYLYFDPGSGRLELHRSLEGGYVRLDPDERVRVWSQEAQLWFGPEGPESLRAYDRDGAPLRSYLEETAFAQAEADRRVEAQRRTEAERRVADLEAELARLRHGNPG